jgi:hypothetical protein
VTSNLELFGVCATRSHVSSKVGGDEMLGFPSIPGYPKKEKKEKGKKNNKDCR